MSGPDRPLPLAAAFGDTALLRGRAPLIVARLARKAVRSDANWRSYPKAAQDDVEAWIQALEDAGAAWEATIAAEGRNLAMRTGPGFVPSGPNAETIGLDEAAALLGVQPRQAGNLARRYQLGPEPGRGRPWRLSRLATLDLAERRRQDTHP